MGISGLESSERKEAGERRKVAAVCMWGQMSAGFAATSGQCALRPGHLVQWPTFDSGCVCGPRRAMSEMKAGLSRTAELLLRKRRRSVDSSISSLRVRLTLCSLWRRAQAAAASSSTLPAGACMM